MMIPEYSPRGTSITYGTATAVPPMVYRLSLKPASPTPATSPKASAATSTSPTATAIVYGQSRSSIPNSSSTGALGASAGRQHGHRHKSYSESALRLEGMLATTSAATFTGSIGPCSYSTGDEVDLIRSLTISGVSKNSHGTWMFKVDVGGPNDSNAYVVRRRFTDFKLLHEGLSKVSKLPELPPHGVVSVFQMLVSPNKLLTARVAQLQELLLVIRAQPSLFKSTAFSSFIGKNPSSYDAGYVSLSGYEVPASQRISSAGSFDTTYSV